MNTRTLRFYDATAMDAVNGMHLVSVPVTKLGVVMDRDRPSDLGGVSVFAGSVQPLDDGRFRMYYYCNAPWGSPRRMRIAVAESGDGLHWDKPCLGQLQHEGQDTNHIRVNGLAADASITQPSVVRLPDGCWRMYFWLHGQERGMVRYAIADSRDGLAWTLLDLNLPAVFHPHDLEVGQTDWTAGLTAADPKAKFGDRRTWDFMAAKRLRSNDATNVYYDAQQGVFEMLSVWLLPNRPETGKGTPHDNAPGVLRVIHRRTSGDGVHFSDPELVIVPDAADPLTQQFYYLTQHREPDWRIGFLGNYHCWEQTLDIEMCFSRDGRHWARPLRGGFIPRDSVPGKGCMSAYSTNNLLPISGGRWLMLYRAGNTQHNHRLGPGVTDEPWYGIMGATWPRGRFAGLATAGRTVGRALLRPFIQVGEEISLNADVHGWVKAELRDPVGGRAIAGFELHACEPVSGNSTSAVLRWGDEKRSSAAFRYDAVQLYLQVSDGVVYGVNV
ncbi:MAG: hypothetical protein A3K19_04155 [Lentisphaerae bacterium RIFOXYB12_FULL_65_16]|nr:MAG: hypothetical protein A3K18_09545 [Lentisphaerae bacterium RIFOXYA12_64_32]OGV84279.1 MAG: hypothetical protein A3K19_04155 [Lentisphaerae bacterium RIFOXYB12_FULL_65_16]